MDALQRPGVAGERQPDGDVRVAGCDYGEGRNRGDVEGGDMHRHVTRHPHGSAAEDHRENDQEHQRENQREERGRWIAHERLVDVQHLSQGKLQVSHELAEPTVSFVTSSEGRVSSRPSSEMPDWTAHEVSSYSVRVGSSVSSSTLPPSM